MASRHVTLAEPALYILSAMCANCTMHAAGPITSFRPQAQRNSNPCPICLVQELEVFCQVRMSPTYDSCTWYLTLRSFFLQDLSIGSTQASPQSTFGGRWQHYSWEAKRWSEYFKVGLAVTMLSHHAKSKSLEQMYKKSCCPCCMQARSIKETRLNSSSSLGPTLCLLRC